MSASRKDSKGSWTDPDDAPEWPDEAWERAEIAVGGEVVRRASGTLAKRGRPAIGAAPKQQVTLRLPREVISYFKEEGAGWQTRISEILQRHVEKKR